MHRTALERVVEVLPVHRRAVDEGGAGRAHGPLMPDRRARSVVVERRYGTFHVILRARSDGEPDDIDHQLLAFAAHWLRNACGVKRNDTAGEPFGDRERGTR